ncbi:C-type lectin domain family 11 member A [Erpetoichthys calabaricus]|uniref:C-type lectin domain family 11 member A n=1 Tax=Erpetoichthys calabaricus TaxID=27687 RepID=UPI0022348E9F|nr:C-type lectin domain family 11 member A [Erpetoichthys calabaricus]
MCLTSNDRMRKNIEVLFLFFCLIVFQCNAEDKSPSSHFESALEGTEISMGHHDPKDKGLPKSVGENQPIKQTEDETEMTGNGNKRKDEEDEEEESVEEEKEQSDPVTTEIPATTNTAPDDTYTYFLSRLADMDAAIHRLNVAYYTLDVKMSQLSNKVSNVESKTGGMEQKIEEIFHISKENQKEIGRIEGCQKGIRSGYKCFLIYRSYENFTSSGEKCKEKGGRMAMPKDQPQIATLAQFARQLFHPGNWPVWLGISDQRSEGLYLFEDGIRVTFFQWRKHIHSSQPDGGRRENCVAFSTDDGDWWDNDCSRRMYYACEFDVLY